jgi:hypothetical protein
MGKIIFPMTFLYTKFLKVISFSRKNPPSKRLPQRDHPTECAFPSPKKLNLHYLRFMGKEKKRFYLERKEFLESFPV